MTTFTVTVSVENAPRLGTVDYTIEAETAEAAEARAIELTSGKWAVGGKWLARATSVEPLEIRITEASLQLFLGLAEDAANWSGMPPAWVSKEERGNLTQLKKAGLLQTSAPDERGDSWVLFSDAGKAFAAKHGQDLSWIDF